MLKDCNYIGVFLTLRCNLGCTYCLNRQGDFANRREIDVFKWMNILEPVETREDLPITLQGGEPTLYKDFYALIIGLNEMGKKIDLLTNGEFDIDQFMDRTSSEMFQRTAPYASIRFSFHQNTNGPKMFRDVRRLARRGYSVGIWGLTHPAMVWRNRMMAEMCKSDGLDYREKEYLDAEHGTYKYPQYMTGEIEKCLCKSSEILFAPDGNLHRCHRDLYAGINPGCSPVGRFEVCMKPRCNNCDTKIKNSRLQVFGHTSVEIKSC